MSKPVKIIVGIILAVVVLIGGISLFVGGQSTKKEIKLGGDKVDTMYSAVGKRDVIGVFSSGGKKSITYKSGAITEADVQSYISHLRGNGYLITVGYNGKTVQLGKGSVDSGQIILVDITFNSLGETEIVYKKGSGTITPY